MRTELIATIDELNQYLNGNVTKKSLIRTLYRTISVLVYTDFKTK